MIATSATSWNWKKNPHFLATSQNCPKKHWCYLGSSCYKWRQPMATPLQPPVAPRPAPRSGCPSLFFQRTGSRGLLGSERTWTGGSLKIQKHHPTLNRTCVRLSVLLQYVRNRELPVWVHPRFRTLTTGFLSEDLVSGPQRQVFFLGTSFQVRLEVWTGYWESRFRSFIEDSGHLGSGPRRFWRPRLFQDLILFLSPQTDR